MYIYIYIYIYYTHLYTYVCSRISLIIVQLTYVLHIQGTLVITKVRFSDIGRYTCTPYSPLGAGRTSSVMQILVKGYHLTRIVTVAIQLYSYSM